MTSLTVRRKVAKNPRRKAVAKRRTKSRKALAHRKRNAMGHFVKAKNPKRRKVRAVAKHAKRRRKSNSSTSSIRAAVSSAVRSALKAQNPRRRRKVTAKRKHKRNSAPALLVTLGAQNPRRKMAARKRRNSASRRRRNTRVVARRKTSRNPFAMRARTANPRRRSHRRRNGRVVARRRNGLRRRRNPSVFGANVPSGSMVKLLLGGLIGVTATKMITAMIPANMLTNNFVKVLASGAVAVVAGNLAKAVPSMGPGFSDAVMFGGLMQAASVALNTFLPSVGSRIALAGRRGGVGDIVDARFSLPENTITNGMLAASARALPAAVPAGAMAGLHRAGFGGGF